MVLWHGGDSRLHDDEVAEWLKRWTANPMCSARMGSNPILVDIFAHTWIREAKKLYQRPTKGESYKCFIQNTKTGIKRVWFISSEVDLKKNIALARMGLGRIFGHLQFYTAP